MKLTAAVFVIAFLIFSFRLSSTGIASGWMDPIARQGAQDEAVYTHQAIRMLTQGNWMTPAVYGRWVLEKPPLSVWLSAISMKLFGIGPYTARLPAVLAGALIVSLCFMIARAGRSTTAGIAAALLCVSNQLLFSMSRHNMTDILLTAATLAVVAVLAWDPPLAWPPSQIAFILAIAAGILIKSIAGLLPALAALVFACMSREWPARLRRTAGLTALAAILASPWFLFQLLFHRDWFLADMGFQILTMGVKPQTSTETHVHFYLIRLLYAAPLGVLLALSGLPALIQGLRRREPLPLLLTSFFAVLSLALLMFRFESEPYLTPLLPVVILMAAIGCPFLTDRLGALVCALIAVGFLVKASNPAEPWGISYQPGSTVPVAGTISHYCEEHRSNDLYVLGVDDELYALALPLTKVRYGWVDPRNEAVALRPHLAYLGILQPAAAPSRLEVFQPRLRAWGNPSTESLATGLFARTEDEFAALVSAHPESDFLVSTGIARRLPVGELHEIGAVTQDYVLLQSRTPLAAAAPGWTCSM